MKHHLATAIVLLSLSTSAHSAERCYKVTEPSASASGVEKLCVSMDEHVQMYFELYQAGDPEKKMVLKFSDDHLTISDRKWIYNGVIRPQSSSTVTLVPFASIKRGLYSLTTDTSKGRKALGNPNRGIMLGKTLSLTLITDKKESQTIELNAEDETVRDPICTIL
jgi:hypothetical protein